MGQHKANVRYIARRRAAAFTLVEVLVVMALLVLLAGMITVVATGVQQRSRASRTQGQITLLGEAVKAFKDATGYFPLAVPEDAWRSQPVWDDFVVTMKYQDRWRRYFYDNGTYYPSFSWDGHDEPGTDFDNSSCPTNIHLLTFQLEQVPDSATILNSFKQAHAVRKQKKRVVNASNEEAWIAATGTSADDNDARLGHPLDRRLRSVYQAQDAWGTPLRFWTGDILKWAKKRDDTYHKKPWDTDILNLLSSRLQQANWGFFIESAGKDGRFGWWGDPDSELDAKAAEDNIYSVGQ